MHLNVRDTSEERVNRCNVKDRLTLSCCPRCKYKMVQSVNIHSIDGIQIAYYLMKEATHAVQRKTLFLLIVTFQVQSAHRQEALNHKL